MAKDGPNPDILRRAIQKTVAKEELTIEERAALRAHQKIQEEETRWKYYETIPAKHWEQMSGRSTKVRNEQAARYDLPFGGAVISLPKLARALHDFLAKNKVKLARSETVVMDGPNSPALERYREERALTARLTRLEREGQLVDRDQVRQSMQKAGAVIRQAGDALQKQFGPLAAQILYEAIDDAEADVERAFAAPVEDATDGAD
jgi:hypothetical protein